MAGWGIVALKADIISKADEAFLKYDANKTGQLDFGEFTTALTEIYAQNGKPKPTFFDLHDALTSVDKDKNRLLDKEEFRQLFLIISGLK